MIIYLEMYKQSSKFNFNTFPLQDLPLWNTHCATKSTVPRQTICVGSCLSSSTQIHANAQWIILINFGTYLYVGTYNLSLELYCLLKLGLVSFCKYFLSISCMKDLKYSWSMCPLKPNFARPKNLNFQSQCDCKE